MNSKVPKKYQIILYSVLLLIAFTPFSSFGEWECQETVEFFYVNGVGAGYDKTLNNAQRSADSLCGPPHRPQ